MASWGNIANDLQMGLMVFVAFQVDKLKEQFQDLCEKVEAKEKENRN